MLLRITQLWRHKRLVLISCIVGLLLIVGIAFAARAKSSTLIQPSQRPYWPTVSWRTTTPQEQGMDAGNLAALDNEVRAKWPQIHSVLVVRHGYLVYESYYQGYRPDSVSEVTSVTKSFTSALVGIALQHKFLASPEQKIADSFPEFITPAIDPRTRDITVRDVLTMTSGFKWSEQSIWNWPQAGDWLQYILSVPMANQPGTTFTYDTPAVHMLSGLLSKATDKSLLDFANVYLFQPLGIPKPQWLTDPQGRNNGGRELFLTARDMAKFGYLYLNNGYWQGKQIVPAQWVHDSTQEQSAGGFPQYERYGYLWWVTSVNGNAAYFAAGYGGQFIYVVPALDLVTVITSDVRQEHTENRQLITNFIVPAVRN